MTNREKLFQELSRPLDMSLVKEREGRGGVILSYLEGHTIISQLNRIFGYDGWEYEITELKETARYKTEKDGKVLLNIGMLARVRLTVYFPDRSVKREDVGYGTGVAADMNAAFESAAKEAVTDALKRAARTLGNQFGNSLYGGKNSEKREEPPLTEKQKAYILSLIDECGLDAAGVEAHIGKPIGELTRGEASRLIEAIKSGAIDVDEAFPEE